MDHSRDRYREDRDRDRDRYREREREDHRDSRYGTEHHHGALQSDLGTAETGDKVTAEKGGEICPVQSVQEHHHIEELLSNFLLSIYCDLKIKYTGINNYSL